MKLTKGFVITYCIGLIIGVLLMKMASNYFNEKYYKMLEDHKKFILTKYKDNSSINDILIKKYINKVNKRIFPYLNNYITKAIVTNSKKYDINVALTIALIDCESDFNVFAKSSKNAIGLMQVNYKLWKKELKEKGIINDIYELYDPMKNIDAGLYILRKYIDATNSLQLALYKYYGKRSKRYYNEFLKALGNFNLMSIKN